LPGAIPCEQTANIDFANSIRSTAETKRPALYLHQPEHGRSGSDDRGSREAGRADPLLEHHSRDGDGEQDGGFPQGRDDRDGHERHGPKQFAKPGGILEHARPGASQARRVSFGGRGGRGS